MKEGGLSFGLGVLGFEVSFEVLWLAGMLLRLKILSFWGLGCLFGGFFASKESPAPD
jgi:hypothetical protein